MFKRLMASPAKQTFTSRVTLFEVERRIERVELEIRWAEKTLGPFEDVKAARYALKADFPAIQAKVRTVARAIQKHTSLLPSPTADSLYAEWDGSVADQNDAYLIAAAKQQGVLAVATDDIDFLSFAGITVHTANGAAIQIATDHGLL